MTEDFTTEALAFLMDELEPARRALFEERLARDPVAAAAFKTCADSLAEFAMAEAPALAPTAAERERSLAGVLALPKPEPSRAKPSPRVGSAFWPMAAAALLALNLGMTALYVRERALAGMRAGAAMALAKGPSSTLHSPPGGPAVADGIAAPSKISPADPGREVKRELDRLTALRQEYARLRGQRDALNAEYQSIVRELEDAAVLDGGANRIVAVQLVDGQSYAKGARNPSLDLSQPIMSGPGVVPAGPPNPKNGAEVPQSSLAGSVASTVPASGSTSGSTATITVTGANLTAISASSGAVNVLNWGSLAPIDSVTGPGSITIASPAPSTTPVSTDPAASAAPNAWSIYDEAAHQGYLDLYNLPTVTSDQALELWVQPVGSSNFVPVGAIPDQYYGGSGSVYYKLPSDSVTPGDIMVTIEPKAVTPTVPTGTTVLRGP